MQTYNSFNELVAGQNGSPLVSDMSVFNVEFTSVYRKPEDLERPENVEKMEKIRELDAWGIAWTAKMKEIDAERSRMFAELQQKKDESATLCKELMDSGVKVKDLSL